MSAKNLVMALTVALVAVGFRAATAFDEFYVDASAASGGDGSSWATAFQTIEDAVSAANATTVDDRIWVKPGVYSPAASMRVTSPCTVGAPTGGVTITYTGLFACFRVQDTDIHFTNIQFQGSGRKVAGIGPLSGIRFTGCVFQGGSRVAVRGDQCRLMMFERCRFENNRSLASGGAILGKDCQRVEISMDCRFEDNLSYSDGGAISLVNCDSVSIRDCVFRRNTAQGEGGAIAVKVMNPFPHTIGIPKYTSVELVDTEFADNEAWLDGGGACIRDVADLKLTNNVLIRNIACGSGGGLKVHQTPFGQFDKVVLLNCTLADNIAVKGGGVSLPRSIYTVHSNFLNTILWNNSAISPGTVLEAQCDLPPNRVDHCCVEDWGSVASYVGYAVINVDPRLRSNGEIGWLSPCINTGDKTLYPGLTSTSSILDIADRPRLQGVEVDMGAYEVKPMPIDSWTSAGDRLDFNP